MHRLPIEHFRTFGTITEDNMQTAYRTRIHIAEDGTLTLSGLPFAAGEEVEVIVLAELPDARDEDRYPLRGEPLRYEDPFTPLDESDWQALQ